MSLESDYLQAWFPDDDADDFGLKLRVQSRWDEEQFQRMIVVADAFLDEFEQKAVVDPRWDFAFTQNIEVLIGLMLHPGFLAENELSLSKEAYRAFIEARVERLKELAERYRELRARFRAPA